MEENRPDNIDKLFRDSLQSFQEAPPGDVWEKIGYRLDQDKDRAYLSRIRTLRRTTACLSLLCIAMGALLIYRHRTPAPAPITSRQAPTAEPGNGDPRTSAMNAMKAMKATSATNATNATSTTNTTLKPAAYPTPSQVPQPTTSHPIPEPASLLTAAAPPSPLAAAARAHQLAASHGSP